MAQFQVAALADNAIVARDGKLSLIGIFRSIRLRTVPARYPKFVVAAVIDQLDQSTNIGLEVVDLKENEVLLTLPPTQFRPPRLGDDLQLVLEIDQLPFKTYGKHEVRILLNGTVAKFIPFTVVPVVQPALQAPKA